MFQGVVLNNFYKVEENHAQTAKKSAFLAKKQKKAEKRMKEGKIAEKKRKKREGKQIIEKKRFYYPFFYVVFKRRASKWGERVVKLIKDSFLLPEVVKFFHEKSRTSHTR